MFYIGKVKIEGNVILAPMAGITSLAYRKFMKPFGVALGYTEMVSDCGLTFKNEETLKYINTSENEHPVAIQLFGGNVDTLLSAIDVLENLKTNYDILDINLGCPVPKVTRSNGGSAWLKNPELLYEMMKKVCEKSTHPVTAKIRLGWDDEHINFVTIVSLLEKAGVSAIAIHARTTKMLYAGKARYEELSNLKSTMKVPLIISGDIFSLSDAISALNITKADAVMVARGALGNPNLVRQIDTYFKTGEIIPTATLKENIEYLKQFIDLLIDEKGEKTAISILRGLAPKFLGGYQGLKQYKTQITENIISKKNLLEILDSIKQ